MKKRQFLGTFAAAAACAKAVEETDWDARPLKEVVVPKSSKLTLIQWYQELVKNDSHVRAEFSRLTKATREGSRELQEGLPECRVAT